MKKYYYAVKEGRNPGIYETWDEAKSQVEGYSSASYKKFKTIEEAKSYLDEKYEKSKDIQSDEYDIDKIPEDTVIAYVDGSYNAEKICFGSGGIMLFKGGEYRFSMGSADETLISMRNVAGEIKASEYAMDYTLNHGFKKLIIFHDYEGIAKWCTGEWKANKEGTINYKKKYMEYEKKLQISFKKVTAHSSDKYNDIADELAKKGACINE